MSEHAEATAGLKPAPNAAEAAPARLTPWQPGECGAVASIRAYDGASEEQVRAALPQPLTTDEFRLGQRPDEFHVELQNYYPLSQPDNANILIHEWGWARGDCRLTLWFHDVDGVWKVVSGLEWNRQMEF
jgi:hypothetical protein